MNSTFLSRLFGNQPVKVAFIGDSITQGFYAAGSTTGTYLYRYFNNPSVVDDKDNPALHSYVNNLRAWMQGKNASSQVLNLGLESSYAAWHVANGSASQVVTWEADACIIALGVNDCMAWGKTINQFKASMQTLISTLHGSGIQAILLKTNQARNALSNLPAITATLDATLPPGSSQDQLAYFWGNQFVKSIDDLGADSNTLVIDLWTVFNSRFVSQGYTESGLMWDVVHPNQTGHLLYSDTITSALSVAQSADVSGLSAAGGVNSVALGWNQAPGATGYRVYRSENGGGSYTLIKTTSALAYTDRREDVSTALAAAFDFTPSLGLEYGKTYTYKVTAYNATGETSGVTASASPVAAAPYVGGTARGKVLACLIAHATDHMTSANPSKAQVQTAHDFLRASITTKITLFVSKQVLFATSGEVLNVRSYLQTLVSSYGYDIVTLPHTAWFPTTTRWSQGLATEKQNITDCHNQCYSVFGKYPVASTAWSYNKDLVAHAVSLGYKLVPSGFREQSPDHPDGWGSLGFPYHLYRPSKNNSLVPGGGSAGDTFDVVSGFPMLNISPYRANNEPKTGRNNPAALGCGDLVSSVFAQQRTLSQVLEDSQALGFNQFHCIPLYFDPYWMFVDGGNGTVASTGEKESWYMQKQIALWLKQRYADLVDFVSASELAAYATATIPLSDPHPPYALLSYVEQEGWLSPQDKQLRYDCQNFSTILRYKSGAGGYIRNIQHVPYGPGLSEPSYPSSNWNIPGGWYRSNSSGAKVWSIVYGGVTANLETGANCTIHAPQVTSDNAGRMATLTWDIYDAADATKLVTLVATLSPAGFTSSVTYAHASVSSVSVQDNLAGTNVLLAGTTTAAPVTTQPPVTTTQAPAVVIAGAPGGASAVISSVSGSPGPGTVYLSWGQIQQRFFYNKTLPFTIPNLTPGTTYRVTFTVGNVTSNQVNVVPAAATTGAPDSTTTTTAAPANSLPTATGVLTVLAEDVPGATTQPPGTSTAGPGAVTVEFATGAGLLAFPVVPGGELEVVIAGECYPLSLSDAPGLVEIATSAGWKSLA